MTAKMSASLRLLLVITVFCELGAFQVEADYDNHWAFYYESPCCGHHHLRHHKGENMVYSYILVESYNRCFPFPAIRENLYSMFAVERHVNTQAL
jgi:hypothetical protein